MEIAESKQAGLEFIRLFITFIYELLIKVGIGSPQIGLKILRCLVRNLYRQLKDRFWDDLHIWQRWRLRAEENSEVGVTSEEDCFKHAL